ncbi:transmembrane protein 208 [Galendromus occidentalis]|uniref:Transmembrane protein 208 n=1 Tax=Galendromus occidentalis TaxID=34638 RepID=A0AAJ6QS71_9ACAR|nr:transmembrane protein 208 [Galendromus occidentalis]
MVIVEPKGKKEATRGQKQIAEENKETLKYYMMMAGISLGIRLTAYIFVGREVFTIAEMLCLTFTVVLQACSLSMMSLFAKCVYGDRQQVVDAGTDLNMKNGNAEYLKDFIILASIIQMLTIASSKFYWLLLAVPGYAIFVLWVNVLGPWFFAPAPAEEEISDKKQRKLDRKMRRMQAR